MNVRAAISAAIALLLCALAWAAHNAALGAVAERAPATAAAEKKADRAERLPHPTDVACFPCHSTVKFAKGPPFAHASAAHSKAGHCHVCHQGMGHDHKVIVGAACTGCHAEGSAELQILAQIGARPEAQPAGPAAPARPQSARTCLMCHTAPAFDALAFRASVHGKLQCDGCHKGFDFSIGARPFSFTDKERALIKNLSGKSTAPGALAACGRCHESQRDDWMGSVHGKWLAGSSAAGATCLDCHGEPHAIRKSNAVAVHAQRSAQSQRCAQCHEDPAVVKSANLGGHAPETFRDSVHGRMVLLQNDRAPGCANCHGAHDIAAVKSAESPVAPANKVKVCAECHKGATATFAATFTHQPLTAATRSAPHYTGVVFSWLTAVVLTLLAIHLVLDFGGEVRHWLRRRRGLEAPHQKLPGSAPRFDKHQLVQHWMLIASVLTLVITDLPVRAAGVPASLSMVQLFGGVRNAGLVHRAAGIVLGVMGVYHLVYLTVLAIKRRLPLSMAPSLKDVKDLLGNGAYFLGLRDERPSIGRYAYHEKFDYWAVFWGVVIMVGTGLVRWFPVAFSKVLPASVLESCQIAHGDEATLAALVLFVWHLYMVHLKPSVFPMSWTWIDGRIDLELLHEEHRAEFDATPRARAVATVLEKKP